MPVSGLMPCRMVPPAFWAYPLVICELSRHLSFFVRVQCLITFVIGSHASVVWLVLVLFPSFHIPSCRGSCSLLNQVKLINSPPTFQGAPETIQGRLVDVPSSYVKTYKKYTRQGSRVLALAFKSLPEMTVRVTIFADNSLFLEIPSLVALYT